MHWDCSVVDFSPVEHCPSDCSILCTVVGGTLVRVLRTSAPARIEKREEKEGKKKQNRNTKEHKQGSAGKIQANITGKRKREERASCQPTDTCQGTRAPIYGVLCTNHRRPLSTQPYLPGPNSIGLLTRTLATYSQRGGTLIHICRDFPWQPTLHCPVSTVRKSLDRKSVV